MSLGNVIGAAAPIAAGYFTGGTSLGIGGAIAAGAATGMGIAALQGNDVLMGGVMGGLGGYGGANMAAASTAAKEAAQGTLTDAAFNEAAQQQVMQQAGTGINSGITGTTGELGANMGQTISQSGRAFPNIGTTGASQGATIGQSYRPDFMATATKNLNVPTAQFGKDYGFSDIATELGEGEASKGYMKAGLTALPVVSAAFEPEYETFDEMREDKYDPNETLNLNDPSLDSGIEDEINKDSGLRLYAKEGGMIPAYEKGGIVNQAPMNVNTAGANVTSGGMNVNNVGANMGLNSVANLNQGASNMQGLGGLNVNTGATSVSDYEQSILDKPLYKDLGFTGIGGGPSRVPYDYNAGNIYSGPNYTTNRDGTFTRVGPVPKDALEVQQQNIRDRLAGTGPMNLNDKGLNLNSRMNINDLPSTKFYATGGMLEGPGDGMSDSLAAKIDGSQPAALSQGEFVVPADVVSHLGNGSSDAGSKRLYAMMDEVRNARTGTKKQGKEIDPERYMPA